MPFIFALMQKRTCNDQGCAGIGYLRSICAKISETPSLRSVKHGDFFTLRFRSGRDADPSEAGWLKNGRGRQVHSRFHKLSGS
jgi:hypothetical protein